MNRLIEFPFYARFAFFVIGLVAVVYIMYIGQGILLPLVFSLIIAILLNPLVNFFVSKRINRVVAISIAVFMAVLVIALLMYFVSVQISMFGDAYPKLKYKGMQIIEKIIEWFSSNLNIKRVKINEWITETESEAVNNMGGAIKQTISTVNSFLIIVFLLPVYLFLILYYKPLILEFIRRIFSDHHHTAVFQIMTGSKKIIQSYLIGLLLEAAIIATLNSVALLLIGVDYAIVLGITGALLNIIPYLGGVIAVALPMIIAFVTKDTYTATVLVLGAYILIQFVDNNFIIPSIVASKVKINALISIIVVLIGGALWGLPGMFLSIPLTAIMKVVFDHIESLKPWGYLLGNIVPSQSKLKFLKIKKRL